MLHTPEKASQQLAYTSPAQLMVGSFREAVESAEYILPVVWPLKSVTPQKADESRTERRQSEAGRAAGKV